MKIRCMIVDDEPLARKVIRNYVEKVPSLELVGESASAMEATALLHEQDVDLVFLDIKMPEVTGIDFLKTLDKPVKVILTTAFSEFALEGYEYAVVDYLLKPVPFERFLKAVNRAVEAISMEKAIEVPREERPELGFVFLKTDRGEARVDFSEIFCIEGARNQVKVHLERETLQVPETLTAMETILPEEYFLRVHKSFIVTISRIDRIQGNKMHLGSMVVPIGKMYKMNVERIVNHYRP